MALSRKVKAALLIAAAILVLSAVWLRHSIRRSATELTVAAYEIAADVTEPVRIVQLSDLHSCEYGEENADLLSLVEAQTPDLIFLTGDMLNRRGSADDAQALCELIARLREFAPVYWSDGNHERRFMDATGVKLHDQVLQAGAVVLDDSYVDITVNDQQIRIGGYYGYYGIPDMITDDSAEQAVQKAFFKSFEDTQRLKLLLCHIPTAWTDWEYIDKYPVDLIFSGHYHGGQARLPLIGGVYAPYVGLFPKYTRGVFYGTQGVCVLSAGLGSEPGIPRVNNLPEIVVVDLIPAQESE